MGDLLVEAGEVELVLNVVLVHLAEELVSAQPAEPRDPAHFLRTGGGGGCEIQCCGSVVRVSVADQLEDQCCGSVLFLVGFDTYDYKYTVHTIPERNKSTQKLP